MCNASHHILPHVDDLLARESSDALSNDRMTVEDGNINIKLLNVTLAKEIALPNKKRTVIRGRKE